MTVLLEGLGKTISAAAAAGVVYVAPKQASPGTLGGFGLVARFSPIKGVTPANVLARNIWMPCVLNTLTVSETALHNEYDTLSAGHFSQAAMGPPSATQFKTLSMDTLTLAWDAKWLVVTGQDPQAFRGALFGVLRARKAVRLMINFHPHPGSAPEFNEMVTLRSSTMDIRPGEGDTRYITVQISQWRDQSAGRRSSSAKAASRKRGVSLPTSVKLTATDTLDSLSYEYYGRYDYWRDIRDANSMGTKVGAKTPVVNLGGRWKVGVKIQIPSVDTGDKFIP